MADPTMPAEVDPLLAEIEEAETAVREANVLGRRALRRLGEVRRRRLEGASYREIAESGAPLGVESLRNAALRMMAALRDLQPRLAATLFAEGMSIGAIARRFGISRPRVSRMISRERRGELGTDEAETLDDQASLA